MGGDDGHSAVPVGCPTFESREASYAESLEQVKALVSGTSELYGSLCNAASVIFYNLNAQADAGAALHALPVNWVGFYLLRSPQELVLGPFQGKPACVRIPVGKGVCGTAAAELRSVRVADVHAFPGHIACDAASRSEVVVPLLRDGALVGVLDIDSPEKDRFSAADEDGLAALCVRFGAALERSPVPGFI